MATVGLLPTAGRGTAPTVRTCYDIMTTAPLCGVTDLTDGKYLDDRNDRAAYTAAQERQAEYLLDQARCGVGTRLLDIGCGYGRILEHAARRGAKAVGITISPPQVAHDRARGLDVRLLNYRNIFAIGTNPSQAPFDALHGGPPYEGGECTWEHAFNAIVANGSLEHFVQAADAAAGRADKIYEDMFAICRRLLADGGRFVTTAIHLRATGQFDPTEIARGPGAQQRYSDAYHFAMVMKWFGGWYPEPGQLERCAGPYFDLVEQEDGTHDYHLTSEYWLRQFRWSLAINPRLWWEAVVQLSQRGQAAWQLLRLQLWDQSWAWQFRPPAPLRLLRQTWVAKV